MTFEEVIRMGEYDPNYLDKFDEWMGLTSYQKLQYTKQAMDIRRQNLTLRLAEMYNVLNFSEKPEIQSTLDKIHQGLSKLNWTKKGCMESMLLKYGEVSGFSTSP